MSTASYEAIPDDPTAGTASHSSMGPGTSFARVNARPHFPSRAAEHDAIDELTWDPFAPNRDTPLSAKRRADFHAQANERWDRIKEAGSKLIEEHRSHISNSETKLVKELDTRAEDLRKILERFEDGDYTAEQMEALLADEESAFLPSLRRRVAAFAELESSALPDDTDPETYYARAEEERFRLMPALRSRKRETEVDW